MVRWMFLVSRCRCRSRPNPLIHGADCRPRGAESFSERFGHEFAQGLPALRSGGFGAAKDRIRNVDGSLHKPILPYLWAFAINGLQPNGLSVAGR